MVIQYNATDTAADRRCQGAECPERKARRLRGVRARSRLRLPCIRQHVLPVTFLALRSPCVICQAGCSKECDVSIGSASATRCAAPPIGCAFRMRRVSRSVSAHSVGAAAGGESHLPPSADSFPQQGGLKASFHAKGIAEACGSQHAERRAGGACPPARERNRSAADRARPPPTRRSR